MGDSLPDIGTFFMVDLRLCCPQQLKYFNKLPYTTDDPKIVAAIQELKAITRIEEAIIKRDRLNKIASTVYLNSQDFYQASRYIPNAEFIGVMVNQSDSEQLKSDNNPNMADFLNSVVSCLLNCSSKLGLTKLAQFTSSSCFFARSWDLFKSLAVFIVKDDPTRKQFKLMCALAIAEASKLSSESLQSLEYTERYVYNYSLIEKSFHARLDLLDWDEKLVIFKMVVDNIHIDLKEEEGMDQFLDANNQSSCPTDHPPIEFRSATISASKIFSFQHEKGNFTFILSLLEVSQVPIGVSAQEQTLSTTGTNERPVCLLVSHPRTIS